jgi:predicted Zn-dependent protease
VRPAARIAAWLLAVAASGCGTYARPSRVPVEPNRFDYAAFLHDHPDLAKDVAEPNYLPFMAHRMALRSRKEDVVVFCRWDEGRFPLAVWVEPPRIDASLQDEFQPHPPEAYVDAAWHAVESWQHDVGPPIAFRRAAHAEDADLRVELIGARGPAPEDGVQVLGATPLGRACRASTRGFVKDRLDVSFDVPEIRVYLADQYGLLPVDQVERNVLHEMGHALGMKGHSPIPADLMYEVARDRRVSHLSTEDINSFRALYRIPNGTVYARVPRDGWPPRPTARAPAGPPDLAPTPYVSSRLGFSLQVPYGWRLVPAPRGVVAIDGLDWDYEGSFQVLVHDYPSIAAYVRQHGRSHLRGGELLGQEPLLVEGHPALHMRVSQQGGSMIEDHYFIETGDGRVVVVIEEASAELHAGFAPWFGAMLDSLQILSPQEPTLPSLPAPAAPATPDRSAAARPRLSAAAPPGRPAPAGRQSAGA